MQKKTVFYDKEAPVSGIQYLSPKFFARDTLFISESTSISLFSKDAAAGVQKIEYKVDNGGYVEGKQLKLTGSGLHKIAFKAYDHVNNEELFKTSEVVVDIDGPEVYVNFSIKSIRQEVVDGETIEVYPPYVNMYIGATDRYCGTQSIFYTIDGGVKRDYAVGSNPSDVQMFTKEKMYSVLVEAVDKLGNKGTKTVRFKIASK